MSEEEKKAIVRAREHLTNPACNYLSDEEIEILLDLIDKQEERLVKFQEHIDKQQKEIEELKTITNSYNSYNVDNMNGHNIIIADSEYFANGTFVEKYISKDKIKEVIKKYYNDYEEQKRYRYTRDVEEEQSVLKDIEKELLEER